MLRICRYASTVQYLERSLLLRRHSRQWERLYASQLSICLFFCLSPKCVHGTQKQFRAMSLIRINRKSYTGCSKNPIIGPLKFKMAEIRHLENREIAMNKYSSAVAKRPRDASYLSVVSFNSTIPIEWSFLYFGFVFTTFIRTIRFYSVVFGVMSRLAVIHTIHGRPWLRIARGAARPRLVCIALYTIEICGNDFRVPIASHSHFPWLRSNSHSRPLEIFDAEYLKNGTTYTDIESLKY